MSASKNPESGRGPRGPAKRDVVVVVVAAAVIVAAVVAGELVHMLLVDVDDVSRHAWLGAEPVLVGGVVVAAAVVMAGPVRELVVCWPAMLLDSVRDGGNGKVGRGFASELLAREFIINWRVGGPVTVPVGVAGTMRAEMR